MTVTLDRDEGNEPALVGVGVGVATKRVSAAKATENPSRSNADCLSSGGAGGCTRGDVGAGAGKRSRTNAGGSTVAGAGRTALGASARQFLRRYHHHVAFRRLVSICHSRREFPAACFVLQFAGPSSSSRSYIRTSLVSWACCARFSSSWGERLRRAGYRLAYARVLAP